MGTFKNKMFRELTGIDSFVGDAVMKGGQLSDPQSYKAQTMNWPQNVYYAWVLYGGVSMSSAMYWIQRYYMKNLYSDTEEYLSKLPYTYSLYGIAETINRVTLVIIWTLILPYTDVIRLLVVTIIKLVSFFTDTKQNS